MIKISNYLFHFFMMLWLSASAQITYETTYNGWANLIQLDVSGYKYCYLDVQNKELKIHNLDHSLWKQVNLNIPSGYTLSTNAYNVSENLFSLDNNVCFLYSYYTTTPALHYESRVMNENGLTLLTIANCNYACAYSAGDNETKLLANCTDYSTNISTTRVYDLPGNINTLSMENPAGIRLLAFPNPAAEIINIPLPDDINSSVLNIIISDVSGKIVSVTPSVGAGKSLQVNTKQLSSGLYSIRIDNQGKIIFQDQFIIQ